MISEEVRRDQANDDERDEGDKDHQQTSGTVDTRARVLDRSAGEGRGRGLPRSREAGHQALRRDPGQAQEALTSRRRRQPADWPTLPIPYWAFETIYREVAAIEWSGREGALPPFEFADEALVASALAHPFQSAAGRDLYPTVPAQAAALFRGLVKNHGLRDGNKRLAVTTMSVFLLANGWVPRYTNLELYRYALRVARFHGNYSVGAIERWIRRNSELMPDDDLRIVRAQNVRIWRREGDLLAKAFHVRAKK